VDSSSGTSSNAGTDGGFDAAVHDDGAAVYDSALPDTSGAPIETFELIYQGLVQTPLSCPSSHWEFSVPSMSTVTPSADVQIERLVRRRGDERELVDTALDVLHGVKAGVDVRIRGAGAGSPVADTHPSVCTAQTERPTQLARRRRSRSRRGRRRLEAGVAAPHESGG
jgi:hypothetical protein